MERVLELIVVSAALVVSMLTYFRLARRAGIIDKPNQRSSHVIPTVRGGGIVFVLVLLYCFFFTRVSYPWFMTGALLLAAISFADDIHEQSRLLRFLVHLIGVALMIWQVDASQYPLWLLMIMAIISIGAINAFNFMDGINGITGIYAIVNLVFFYIINRSFVRFVDEDLIVVLGVSVLIFLVFNFRKKAVCFAGDVGSITLAYCQIFLLLLLVSVTNNFAWVLMFAVFGVDSVITIVYRLRRGENMFKAHRTHLYQYLANELKLPHRLVSAGYGLVQTVINIILITFWDASEFVLLITALLVTATAYMVVRHRVMLAISNKMELHK